MLVCAWPWIPLQAPFALPSFTEQQTLSGRLAFPRQSVTSQFNHCRETWELSQSRQEVRAIPAGQSQAPVSALQLPTPLQPAVQDLVPRVGGVAVVVRLEDNARRHQSPMACLHRIAMAGFGIVSWICSKPSPCCTSYCETLSAEALFKSGQ